MSQTHVSKSEATQEHNNANVAGESNSQLFDKRSTTAAQFAIQRMMRSSPHTAAQLAMQSQAQHSLIAQRREMAGGGEFGSGNHPIQLYSYKAGAINKVTVTGSAGTQKTFNETTANSVSYTAGEKCAQSGGTATGTAEWSGVVIDAGTGNAATQMHIVNKDWGGGGGHSDGNIFPGSQSLNGHHKVQENAFRKLFTGANSTAPVDMTYTCSTSGPIGDHAFPSGTKAPDVTLADHTVNVTVTDDTNNTTLLSQNVAAGPGMLLRDPQ
jgi:hypothetical protein